MFLRIIPYRCKIEQPDTRKHNGIKNSENRNVHVEVVLLRLFKCSILCDEDL